MRAPRARRHYVYVWWRLDTNQPLYVGKGQDGRFYNMADRPPGFQEAIESGNCECRIGFISRSERAALDEEARLIKLYGRADLGEGPLLNRCDGSIPKNRPTKRGESRGELSPANRRRELSENIHRLDYDRRSWREWLKSGRARPDEIGPAEDEIKAIGDKISLLHSELLSLSS